MDESGTPDVPGNTSHFVLVGVSIPAWHWKDADACVSRVLAAYGLQDAELHTGWLVRPYLEQTRIPNFDAMSHPARRAAVQRERNAHLLNLQKTQQSKTYKQVKKNYRITDPYVHLTFAERRLLVEQVSDQIAKWGYCRLFGECIDKLHFDPARTGRTISEQAFEQIASRFERYLANMPEVEGRNALGLLVHDNNHTVAHKHTAMMRSFQSSGTLWTNIEHIMETPMFVDSKLTRMVQVADLCAYALRRYLENQETNLFHRIFQRAARLGATVVGVRHYTKLTCACEICLAHR